MFIITASKDNAKVNTSLKILSPDFTLLLTGVAFHWVLLSSPQRKQLNNGSASAEMCSRRVEKVLLKESWLSTEKRIKGFWNSKWMQPQCVNHCVLCFTLSHSATVTQIIHSYGANKETESAVVPRRLRRWSRKIRWCDDTQISKTSHFMDDFSFYKNSSCSVTVQDTLPFRGG